MLNKRQIIKELGSYKNLRSNRALAEFLGINEQNIANWIKRGSLNIGVILSKMPEISPEWLKTGEGPMLKAEGITIGTVNDFSRQHAGHDINNGPVISQDPQKVAALEAENEHLKQTIEQQERLIQSKDELINTLKTLIKA